MMEPYLACILLGLFIGWWLMPRLLQRIHAQTTTIERKEKKSSTSQRLGSRYRRKPSYQAKAPHVSTMMQLQFLHIENSFTIEKRNHFFFDHEKVKRVSRVEKQDNCAITPEVSPWPQTIGILGGMGPLAHIQLELNLLEAARTLRPLRCDQDYPPWILFSCTQLADRTKALGCGTTKLQSQLLTTLEKLATSGADFAVIACNTAHSLLESVKPCSRPLPILSLVDETLHAIAQRFGRNARIGFVGTDGTLKSRLYQRAAARLYPQFRISSLLDTPEGTELQPQVMDIIYGSADTPGLKSGRLNTVQKARALEVMAQGQNILSDAQVMLLGCTELSLLYPELQGCSTPWIDPLTVVANAAVQRAATSISLES